LELSRLQAAAQVAHQEIRLVAQVVLVAEVVQVHCSQQVVRVQRVKVLLAVLELIILAAQEEVEAVELVLLGLLQHSQVQQRVLAAQDRLHL
jgi:hypothetical protein